jgi:hypothetical protein
MSRTDSADGDLFRLLLKTRFVPLLTHLPPDLPEVLRLGAYLGLEAFGPFVRNLYRTARLALNGRTEFPPRLSAEWQSRPSAAQPSRSPSAQHPAQHELLAEPIERSEPNNAARITRVSSSLTSRQPSDQVSPAGQPISLPQTHDLAVALQQGTCDGERRSWRETVDVTSPALLGSIARPTA